MQNCARCHGQQSSFPGYKQEKWSANTFVGFSSLPSPSKLEGVNVSGSRLTGGVAVVGRPAPEPPRPSFVSWNAAADRAARQCVIRRHAGTARAKAFRQCGEIRQKEAAVIHAAATIAKDYAAHARSLEH